MTEPHAGAAPPADIRGWLVQRDWPRLQRHFATVAPTQAHEFEARAFTLMALQPGPGGARRALADLRQACALQPGNVLSAANLMQALIDAGESAEALRLTTDAMRQAPQVVELAEKHVLALLARSQWDEARRAAHHALAAAQAAGAQASPAVARAAQDLDTVWWGPRAMGDVVLRLPLEQDQDFLARCFGERDFIRRYRRSQEGDEAGVRAFLDLARVQPRQSRRLDWIVCQGPRPVGLASLSDLDFTHRRGELLVGLPEADARVPVALKASLAVMDFAFDGLRLHKLVSYVYGDNAQAQANTLHLGLRQEGLLRGHLLTSDGPLDLYVNGLLADEWRADARLQRMIRRWRAKPAGTG